MRVLVYVGVCVLTQSDKWKLTLRTLAHRRMPAAKIDFIYMIHERLIITV